MISPYHAAVLAREPKGASLLEEDVARHDKLSTSLLRTQSFASTVCCLVCTTLSLMRGVPPRNMRSDGGGS